MGFLILFPLLVYHWKTDYTLIIPTHTFFYFVLGITF